jgi:hypothetical protein
MRILGRAAPILLVILVLALGWAFIFVVPTHLVPKDLVPDGTARVRARHEDRATLLQTLVGVLILVGAYLTWQQVRVSREGQITERFTRAVDQLAAAQADVRVGGLYALERIARDSPGDRNTIISVITAFIRVHSPWPPRLPGQYVEAATNLQIPFLESRAPDIQAAMTIIGRLPATGSPFAVDVLTSLRHGLTRTGGQGAIQGLGVLSLSGLCPDRCGRPCGP